MALGNFTQVLLLFALLSSCIGTTRHAAAVGGCPNALKAGERVLVSAIPRLSGNKSFQLYQQLEQEFSQKGIPTAYVVEQEFELAQQGIKAGAAPDSANLRLMQQAGYTYYLELAVGGVASGMGYTQTSAQEQREIQQGYGTAESDDSKATVHFKLYATEEREAVYTLATTARMSGITLPGNEQEGGHRSSSTVNLSSASRATEKALRKGAKELLDKCKAGQ